MPKLSVPYSPDQLAVFNAGLRHLVRLGRLPGDITADPAPYQLWLLDAEDLRRPEPIQFAYQIGWRYFATSASNQTVVGADVAGGTQPLLLNMSYGATVAAEYQQAKRAESLDLMAGATVSVRTLRIPGALLQAVWAQPVMSNDAGQLLPFGKSFVDPGLNRVYYPTNEYLQQVHPTSAIPRLKGLRRK